MHRTGHVMIIKQVINFINYFKRKRATAFMTDYHGAEVLLHYYEFSYYGFFFETSTEKRSIAAFFTSLASSSLPEVIKT